MEINNGNSNSVAQSNTRTYLKRWFVLAIFCVLSAVNGFQWLQYSIINDILIQYYNVPSLAIDWTSMIYMLVYIPFIIPASCLLDKYGLRVTLILGAFGNCLGAWIKCGSANPGRFYVTFIGQTIAALAQIFTLNVPARLAAIWFGPNEVSTATAIGVFGNQLGNALGFLIPPMIVKNISIDTNYSSTTFDSTVTNELQIMFFGTASLTTIIFVLVVLCRIIVCLFFPKFVSEKPSVPPSFAQLGAIKANIDENYLETLKSLFKNINFDLLLIAYGINVGVFYALSTLLNPILIDFFPVIFISIFSENLRRAQIENFLKYKGQEENIGRIGLLLVLAGMLGSLVCGIWLDKTKRYKSTVCIVYLFSFVGMIVFTFTINLGHIWIVFLVAAFLGFFTTGYLPLGFEYGCEMTYPLPEGTSSGLLNGSAQIFGIILTTSIGYLLQYSALHCNLTLSAALAVGTIITFCTKADLRRYKAESLRSSKDTPA